MKYFSKTYENLKQELSSFLGEEQAEALTDFETSKDDLPDSVHASFSSLLDDEISSDYNLYSHDDYEARMRQIIKSVAQKVSISIEDMLSDESSLINKAVKMTLLQDGITYTTVKVPGARALLKSNTYGVWKKEDKTFLGAEGKSYPVFLDVFGIKDEDVPAKVQMVAALLSQAMDNRILTSINDLWEVYEVMLDAIFEIKPFKVYHQDGTYNWRVEIISHTRGYKFN